MNSPFNLKSTAGTLELYTSLELGADKYSALRDVFGEEAETAGVYIFHPPPPPRLEGKKYDILVGWGENMMIYEEKTQISERTC